MSRLPRETEFRKTTLLSSVHTLQYLYKTAYEKQKGHYIGCRNANEDPKLVWAANVLKIQNDRLYKKAYNDSKAKISIPGDMVSISAAKEGQALASNMDYRQYLHHWSCLPDQNDVIQARKAYDLQSDVRVCLHGEHQPGCLGGGGGSGYSPGRKPSTALPGHSFQCLGKHNISLQQHFSLVSLHVY